MVVSNIFNSHPENWGNDLTFFKWAGSTTNYSFGVWYHFFFLHCLSVSDVLFFRNGQDLDFGKLMSMSNEERPSAFGKETPGYLLVKSATRKRLV